MMPHLLRRHHAAVSAHAVTMPHDAPRDWTWVLGQDGATRARNAARAKALRQSRIVMACALAFFLMALLAIGVPWFMQWRADVHAAQQTKVAEDTVAGWPYPKAELALQAAEAYNARLAQSGQPTLGETYDPFTDEEGGVSDQTVESSKDKEYASLLDAGDSVIGSVKIPKISVNLPIRHGTSKLTLDRGAGHLYGTSLPTGGASTHTVLTGHRGLVDALMFTRLDEMKMGDFIYEKVFGRTLAYRVDRIHVIEPTDTSQLRIADGEDRLTLMTCTPYGINTQRLLVSGVRVDMPDPAPGPDHAPKDLTRVAQWSVVVAMAVLIALLMLRRALPSARAAGDGIRSKHRSR